MTPESIANPPELAILLRRAGTWDTFRQTMIARLAAASEFPALAGLRTREPDDLSIALIDAAALVGDVLTFYNERLANEGYLRTAIARRSLTELGKLVGYRSRPGVAASGWLAFSLEDDYAITVPAGTRVQSVPSTPQESAQTFETSADLAARAELNAMKPRPSVPQEIFPANVLNVETLWLKGIGLSLKPGDLLLFVFPEDEAASTPRKIHAVSEDAATGRTTVRLVVEKLSAAYYLPVLAKAAQAVRASIPAEWLIGDRQWAVTVAASLARFAAGLTADTSLLAIEKLFHPNSEILDDKGLDEDLKAAFAEGTVANGLASGLASRAAWGANLAAKWGDILAAARFANHPGSVEFVAARKLELDDGKISDVAGLLLDEVTGSLKNLIDNASTPAAVKTELQSMRANLTTAWNAAETMMRTALDSEHSDDKSLRAIARKSPPLVAALPSVGTAHNVLAEAFGKMAAKYAVIYIGNDDVVGAKTDLVGVGRTGALAASLAAQRERFRSESVTSFSRALHLLTGRYRDLRPVDEASGKVAAEVAALAALINGNPGIAEMHAALAASLGVVTAAVKTSVDARLHRLEAEMRILSGQVAVSPSGVSSSPASGADASSAALGNIVSGTVLAQPTAPGEPLSVPRSLGAFLPVGSEMADGAASDAISRLAGRLAGSSDDDLFDAWRKLNTGSPTVEIHVMRVQTGVFGSAAPMRFGASADTSFDARFALPGGTGDWTADFGDLGKLIRLDGEHGNVVRDGWVVIERPQTIVPPPPPSAAPAAPAALWKSSASEAVAIGVAIPIFILDFLTVSVGRPDEVIQTMVRRVSDVRTAAHSAYGVSGKATTVSLLQEEAWGADANLGFGVIRRTKVFAASELLTLAEMPVGRDVGRAATAVKKTAENPFAETSDVLVLNGLFQGMRPGRRLIVAGQRVDSVSEREVCEYALVAKVEHVLTPAAADPQRPVPGDTPHTRVTLSKKLQYVYRRGSVTIYGNVAEATHGETRRETLGGGNARAVYQRFPLRSVPVTHTAATTATGAASSVQLRVDRVLWNEAQQFTGAGPNDHTFVLEIAGDGATEVVFGNGIEGARLPTGRENVTAVYRTGIGRGGNVGADTLTTLLDRPLGLKGVGNPISASGGADCDSAEDIRQNAALPLLALDRLVSVSDYAAFARAFAGIGKAQAELIHAGGGSWVLVTVAGKDDALLDGSALVDVLTETLMGLGDPSLAVRVQPRELLVLLLAANVRIDGERAWEDIEPAIRAALLKAFGFSMRQPGQDVFLSEAVAVMQAVAGVDFVDVDSFAGIPQKKATVAGRLPLAPAELEAAVRGVLVSPTSAPLPPMARVAVEAAGFDATGALRPAQLAMFLPDLPETLILNQILP